MTPNRPDPGSADAGVPDEGASGDGTDRWRRLQRLRRSDQPLEPWLIALETGLEAPQPDLLAALWGRLERAQVERLLAGPAADPRLLLEAVRPESPALAAEPGVQQAWLEPLLVRAADPAESDPQRRLAWLELLGPFRDRRVAALLRQELRCEAPTQARLPLLPLLGRQRCRDDGELLLRLALEPGPLAWRRAALEGLAVGLSSWPQQSLAAGLSRLAADLDPALAAGAVDLLARLPDGQRQLRRLQPEQLDPAVAARLKRRLALSPLVLVVHGRQGGVIPPVLHDLAAELEQRRGAPVLLQALSGEPPVPQARVGLAAARAGALTLVPLLLLPGEHVRRDLPQLAAAWRARIAAGGPALPAGICPAVRRRPFLGGWPAWQRLLAALLDQAAAGRPLAWLHHPLQGPLADRYLAHLAQVLARPGRPAAYQGDGQARQALAAAVAVLAPLTLAPNRLSESLRMTSEAPSAEVLPPLLELPAVRDFLLASLEALP